MDFSVRLVNILENSSFIRAIVQLDHGVWPQGFIKTVISRDATDDKKISLCMLIIKAPNLCKKNLPSIYPTLYPFNPKTDSITTYIVNRAKTILNIKETNEYDDYNDDNDNEQDRLLLLDVSPISFVAADHFPNIVSLRDLLYICSFDTTHLEYIIKILKPFLSSKGLLREFASGRGFVDAQLTKYLTGREYNCTLLEQTEVNSEDVEKFAFAFLDPIPSIQKKYQFTLTPSLVGYNGKSLFLQHNFDQSHNFTGTAWRMQHRAVYRDGKNIFAALDFGEEAMQAVVVQDLIESSLLLKERFFRRPIILIGGNTLTRKERVAVEVATPIYIKNENASVSLRFNVPLVLSLSYQTLTNTIPANGFWTLQLNAVDCSQSYTVSVNTALLNSHYNKNRNVIHLGGLTSAVDLNPVSNGYILRGSNFSQVIVFDQIAINLCKMTTVHSINGKSFTNSVPQICLI